jgi:CTP-dependent riboflavin kinase
MRFSKKYWGTVEPGGQSSSKWMPQYIDWLTPGTLNIRIGLPMPNINWHKEIDTHYNSPCRISDCIINGERAFLINPPEIGIDPPRYLAEIGHTENLREKLGLRNGSRVYVRFDFKK